MYCGNALEEKCAASKIQTYFMSNSNRDNQTSDYIRHEYMSLLLFSVLTKWRNIKRPLWL